MSRGSSGCRPRLARGARLRHDPARGFVLLGPERVLLLDETAYAILAACDGRRTLAEVAAHLAAEHQATEAEIAADACELLVALASRRLVELE